MGRLIFHAPRPGRGKGGRTDRLLRSGPSQGSMTMMMPRRQRLVTWTETTELLSLVSGVSSFWRTTVAQMTMMMMLMTMMLSWMVTWMHVQWRPPLILWTCLFSVRTQAMMMVEGVNSGRWDAWEGRTAMLVDDGVNRQIERKKERKAKVNKIVWLTLYSVLLILFTLLLFSSPFQHFFSVENQIRLQTISCCA